MENKLLMQDLSAGMSRRSGLGKRESEAFVRTFFAVISQYLQEDKIVKIKGMGTFKVVEVSGRDSVNVNTGERIHIKGHSKVTFTPDTTMRDIVNRPFADFETIILNDGVDVAAMEYIDEAAEAQDVADDIQEDATAWEDDNLTTLPEGEDALLDEALQAEEQDSPVAESPFLPAENVQKDSLAVSAEEGQEVASIPENGVSEPVSGVGMLSEAQEYTQPEAQEYTLKGEPAAGIVEPAEEVTEEELPDVQPRPSVVGTVRHVEPSVIQPEVMAGATVLQSQPISQGEEGQQEAQGQQETQQGLHEKQGQQDNQGGQEPGTGAVMSGHDEGGQSRQCRILYAVVKVMLVILLMVLSYLAGTSRLFECKTDDTLLCCTDTLCHTDSLPVQTPEVTEPGDSAAVVPEDTLVVETEVEQPQDEVAEVEPSQDGVEVIESAPVEVGKTYPQVKGGIYEIVGVKGYHTLQRGESVSIVARIYFSDPKLSVYVATLNQLANPDLVEEGQVLKIPILKRK